MPTETKPDTAEQKRAARKATSESVRKSARKLHDVVNNGSMDAHFLITYLVPAVVPAGSNKRTDEPAPPCAAALGLK